MADPYVPPVGNALHLQFKEKPYTPPAGNALHLQLGGGSAVTGDLVDIAGTFSAMTGFLNAASIITDGDIAGHFEEMTGFLDVPTLSADIGGEFKSFVGDIVAELTLTASITGLFSECGSGIDATGVEYQAAIAGEFWPMGGNILSGPELSGVFGSLTGQIDATSLIYSATIAGEFDNLEGQIETAYCYEAQLVGVFGSMAGSIATSDYLADETQHEDDLVFIDSCGLGLAASVVNPDPVESLEFSEGSCVGVEATEENTANISPLAYAEEA